LLFKRFPANHRRGEEEARARFTHHFAVVITGIDIRTLTRNKPFGHHRAQDVVEGVHARGQNINVVG